MTDIVERLRADGALAGYYDAPAIQREAADEIERLRSALRDLLADTPHADHNCGDPDCPVDRARAALRGNGHD